MSDGEDYENRPTEVEITYEFLRELEDLMYHELRDRGNIVYEWPEDEAEAYRDNFGFTQGLDAVRRIRAKKAVQEFVKMVKNP